MMVFYLAGGTSQELRYCNGLVPGKHQKRASNFQSSCSFFRDSLGARLAIKMLSHKRKQLVWKYRAEALQDTENKQDE